MKKFFFLFFAILFLPVSGLAKEVDTLMVDDAFPNTIGPDLVMMLYTPDLRDYTFEDYHFENLKEQISITAIISDSIRIKSKEFRIIEGEKNRIYIFDAKEICKDYYHKTGISCKTFTNEIGTFEYINRDDLEKLRRISEWLVEIKNK